LIDGALVFLQKIARLGGNNPATLCTMFFPFRLKALFSFYNVVLIKPQVNKLGEIEIRNGSRQVARIGKCSREVEQKPAARKDRVDVLALRFLPVSLMRLVQQYVPFSAVVIISKINDPLFLFIAHVVGPVSSSGPFLLPA
jgi:hypothetical protein